MKVVLGFVFMGLIGLSVYIGLTAVWYAFLRTMELIERLWKGTLFLKLCALEFSSGIHWLQKSENPSH